MNAPLVSVVLPVWNGARDLAAAVGSILGQTFRDFELIAINDCSKRDNSGEILDGLAASTGDRRLRVIHHEQNRGLAGTLNHGIELSRGRYVARQDQDDISRPERLALQVAFMETNRRCGLLGTRAEIWVGDQPTERVHDHATENAELQIDLLANNPFVHSSVMLRRSKLDVTGLYSTDPARQPPEDYELWSRMARHCEVANLPQRLLVYREVPGSMSRTGANPFLDKLILISGENIAFWSGTDAGPDAFDAAALIHAAPARIRPDADINAIADLVERACAAIAAANPRTDIAARSADLVGNVRFHYMCARHPDRMQRWRTVARALPIPPPLMRRIKHWMSGRT